MVVNYIFDGTFEGILTAIFESYERKNKVVKLVEKNSIAKDLFADSIEIVSNKQKALRVLNGLKKSVSQAHFQNYIKAYFIESSKIYQSLFDYALYIFNNKVGSDNNYGNEHVLAVSEAAQKVRREVHRMKAFIRFQQGMNGLYYAIINPDFNVIPLIVNHFKNRYADQPWVIYDEKRKFGIHYDLNVVQEVTFEVYEETSIVKSCDILLDEKEWLFSQLWKDYFKSTNIKERKNLKLHLQHVPKRYWRYLTEKSGN